MKNIVSGPDSLATVDLFITGTIPADSVYRLRIDMLDSHMVFNEDKAVQALYRTIADAILDDSILAGKIHCHIDRVAPLTETEAGLNIRSQLYLLFHNLTGTEVDLTWARVMVSGFPARQIPGGYTRTSPAAIPASGFATPLIAKDVYGNILHTETYDVTLGITGPQGPQGLQGIEGKGYKATSNTSATLVNSGSVSLTLNETNLAYLPGLRVRVADQALPNSNYMEGIVTGYAANVLTFTADYFVGDNSAPLLAWNVGLTGRLGGTGLTGPGYYATSTDTTVAFPNPATLPTAITLNTQTNLAYRPGDRVRLSAADNVFNYIEGVVTSYSGTSLITSIDHVVNYPYTPAGWNIGIAGDIGASGTGSVSSVGLALPSEFTITGSPVTNTGTLTGAWATQTTNKFLAAPNGSTGAPSFRTIVNADLPTNIKDAIVSLTNAASVATNSDLGRMFELITTQNFTLANPTGTPFDGQEIIYRIKGASAFTIAYGTNFAGSTDTALPSAITGSSKWDYLGFRWNATSSKWDYLAKNFGH